MIIRMVKKDRTIHDAFVFAYKADGWKTKVIILDEDKDKFVEVPLWKRKYNLKSNVSIIEGDLSEYYQVDAKTFSFWNIPNIFLLVKQQNYPENYISDALSIQKDLEVVTWHQVT